VTHPLFLFVFASSFFVWSWFFLGSSVGQFLTFNEAPLVPVLFLK
jgi:hypothetical protein